MPSRMCHSIPNPNPHPTTGTIPLLKNNKDWPKWNLETHQTLKNRDFTSLLKDTNKPPLSSPAQLRTWNHAQKTACAIVISKLTPTIAKAMHPHKTLETLLNAVDKYTKPTPSEALEMLVSLWTRLSTLHSSQHASITDYCAEARDIGTQYHRLGTPISDTILSCAFISGLPFDWKEWKIRRTQNETILVPWDECSSSTFTFENLVRDALEEEGRLYRAALRDEDIKWGLKIRDVGVNEVTVVVDFCTVCHGVFHTASACSGISSFSQVRRSRSRRKANSGLKRRRVDSRGRYAQAATGSLGAAIKLGLGSDVFLFSS